MGDFGAKHQAAAANHKPMQKRQKQSADKTKSEQHAQASSSETKRRGRKPQLSAEEKHKNKIESDRKYRKNKATEKEALKEKCKRLEEENVELKKKLGYEINSSKEEISKFNAQADALARGVSDGSKKVKEVKMVNQAQEIGIRHLQETILNQGDQEHDAENCDWNIPMDYEYLNKFSPEGTEDINEFLNSMCGKIKDDYGVCETVKGEQQLTLDSEWEIIMKRFDACDISGKQALKKKLRELDDLATTFLVPPVEKAKTKGRTQALKMDTSTRQEPSDFEIVESSHDSIISLTTTSLVKLEKKTKKLPVYRKNSKSRYMDSFPVEIRSSIHDVVDVKYDGHCGFRAIAASLGMSVEAWPQVRQDLMDELSRYRDDYVHLYGCQERVDELMQSLMCFNTVAYKDNWMTLPDMGLLISSRYDVVLIYLSSKQCLTYLPLRSIAPFPLQHRLITIGFVSNCHFVQVLLKPRAPIPPIACNWRKFRHECAREWELPYVFQIENFKLLFSSNTDVATQDIINLDEP